MAPKTLEQVLKSLPKGEIDKNLIVGYESKDDAAVYKINDDVSIIAHGGTLMAVLENLCDEKKNFYDWHIGNAHGYITEYNGENIHIWKKF